MNRIDPETFARKGNQPTPETEVEAYFETAPAEELVCKTTVEKGHGLDVEFKDDLSRYRAGHGVKDMEQDGNGRDLVGLLPGRLICASVRWALVA